MKKIRLLNPISKAGLERLPGSYLVNDTEKSPDAILVRSASMHDTEIPKSLLAVARAGAGVNNIPVEALREKGIVVFNTPGANANGVKELTIAALFLAARDIYGGIKWTETLSENVAKSVEKGKKEFAGIELFGKTLGVIGLGAIGGAVANAAASSAIGMKVIGFDPYLSIEGAKNLSRSVKLAQSYEEIFANADFVTLHVPATPQTKGLIDKKTLGLMKDGVRIINLSRAELIDDGALIKALQCGKVARYVTDFPTDTTVGVKNLITIPHLGASTEESEDNCAILAVTSLIEYLENGNIINSVNFPKMVLPRTTALRLSIMHLNTPSMITTVMSIVGDFGITVANMASVSSGDMAYTVLDIDTKDCPEGLIQTASSAEGVVAFRVIS